MIRLIDIDKNLGGQQVLSNLNLTVESGEVFVIVGGSGTGKSVTLKHLVGLMSPDRGEVIIDGVDINLVTRRDRIETLKKFGMLFQSGALINWMTVFENIAFPLYEKTDLGDNEIRKLVREKLDMVKLSGCEDKRPSEISGGMKKRVALARAIILGPQIVLYDEPTSGLDPVMSRHIDKLIMDLQQNLGITSIVVTHDLHSAFTIADQIAMMHKGKIIEVNPPEIFCKSENEVVSEFIKAQFEMGKIEGILQ